MFRPSEYTKERLWSRLLLESIGSVQAEVNRELPET